MRHKNIHKDWVVRIEGDGNNALSVRAQTTTYKTEEQAHRYIAHMRKKFPDDNIKYYVGKLSEAKVYKPHLNIEESE